MVENGNEYVPPSGWVDITPDIFADAPFKVYANHFKSGSDRLKAFINDPRAFLTGAFFEEYGFDGEPIEGVGDNTQVRTFFTNHHNTLLRMILYATAIVSPSATTDGDDSVSLTLYKHGPKD